MVSGEKINVFRWHALDFTLAPTGNTPKTMTTTISCEEKQTKVGPYCSSAGRTKGMG